ncbi:MFS transporter [Bariatricus massiliensis]|uniref:MFS transporter n=1 Tax=Bariatricus massiliensis TaxID=1745713 RepID=A0ABS8DD72_9FIRM|nr:MFS transporter [Bariatricus massiliensis]MCB7303568.1 MFS transporter [Bariatricus massiliensis]MCB7373700.1 MFS transporter [Bariatricus massiliensis]MCB7386370.1 MFS transporter [Bariatricus massiliensis]MCB7410532.1 MFS transporter [Bariatricus massiliensis]MCQ5252184.1 MFS transporter [Bariatricus massiliensis]
MSEKEKSKLSRRQWMFLIILSLGWSGVMVMGYFYTSYYSLIQNVFGYTDMEIANLAAIQSFVGAFGYLVGGFIADNIKPKISITIAYAGLCVCGALAVMRSGYMIMQLVAVGVSGFGLALFCVPMMRYISTLGTREQESTLYGWFYGLAAAESLVIAPIASKIINKSGSGAGLNAIIFFFCGMMLVSWIGHMVFIEPQYQKMLESGEIEQHNDGKFSLKLVGDLLKNPNTYFIIAIGVATVLPYDLNTFVQPLLASEFGASQSTIQFVASYANNGTALILAPLAGVLAAKIGSVTKSVALSLCMAIAAAAAILILPWGAKYLTIAVIIVFFLRGTFSFGKPARNTMIGESRLPRRARGTVIGLLNFVTGLQSTLIAKGAGTLTTNYGTNKGYHILYTIGLCLFVAGLIICIFFARRLERAKKQDEANGSTPEGLMI